ncbi:L-dopachrome tautomerase-related protein [uncultured Xylophilus sp.]|uniref:L-dopachrome tautomerase-related protein n=1 Tax=uncultured Xylophilus sp. TaxID=296832 RepID=UPI0025D54C55|nr:L-dopachrome tautomerase-related protein [uncultured Xylophilus sp.]
MPPAPLARRHLLAGSLGATLAATGCASSGTPSAAAPGPAPDSARPDRAGLELVRAMRCPSTPTGIALSPDGQRLFVFMPRFDAQVPYTVGEVRPDGSVVPWPDAERNRPDPQRPQVSLVHVPNGVFDAAGRLWLLDAGLATGSGAPMNGAPKLLCLDIADGRVLKTVPLSAATVPTSSLNDLRVRAGGSGREVAYITDQGQDGKGALMAVDLASGRAVRRLAEHGSTASVKGVLKIVEGRPVERVDASGQRQPVQGGANGIALSHDGATLYYAPLMGRRLYAVDTAALLDAPSDAAVAATVRDLGEKGMTGGLACDDRDRVYLTLQESEAVGRRHPDGRIEMLGTDPRLLWPDTFHIARDGWLYVNAAQVQRRPEYHGGTDRQQPPYLLFRLRIDAGPAAVG